MDKNSEADGSSESAYSIEDYRKCLRDFDSATCEAIAVGQSMAQRLEVPTVGYSTHVFTRLCAHAQAIMCAVPESRWVRRDFDVWDVSTVAPHVRAILEGYLLFRYLADASKDKDTQKAYVNVMHLYDCLKRIKILRNQIPDEDIDWFKSQAVEIKKRLRESNHFMQLDNKLKKDLLSGKWMMITPQRQLIAKLNIDQEEYDFYWNYISQYTHILSFSFYRMESNGRGTGVENDFDRGAICKLLEFSCPLMVAAVDRLVEMFPDAADVRLGLNSEFSPGPARNRPNWLIRCWKKLHQRN